MVVEVVIAEVAAVAVEADVDSVETVEVLAVVDMVEVENAADTVVVVEAAVAVTEIAREVVEDTGNFMFLIYLKVICLSFITMTAPLFVPRFWAFYCPSNM